MWWRNLCCNIYIFIKRNTPELHLKFLQSHINYQYKGWKQAYISYITMIHHETLAPAWLESPLCHCTQLAYGADFCRTKFLSLPLRTGSEMQWRKERRALSAQMSKIKHRRCEKKCWKEIKDLKSGLEKRRERNWTKESRRTWAWYESIWDDKVMKSLTRAEGM